MPTPRALGAVGIDGHLRGEKCPVRLIAVQEILARMLLECPREPHFGRRFQLTKFEFLTK
jgi:hypothetical protein